MVGPAMRSGFRAEFKAVQEDTLLPGNCDDSGGLGEVQLRVLRHDPRAPPEQLGINLFRYAVHASELKQQRH